MTATTVTVIIHKDDNDSWWASSPQLPGFTAVGDSEEGLRRELHDAVAFALDVEDANTISLVIAVEPPPFFARMWSVAPSHTPVEQATVIPVAS